VPDGVTNHHFAVRFTARKKPWPGAPAPRPSPVFVQARQHRVSGNSGLFGRST